MNRALFKEGRKGKTEREGRYGGTSEIGSTKGITVLRKSGANQGKMKSAVRMAENEVVERDAGGRGGRMSGPGNEMRRKVSETGGRGRSGDRFGWPRWRYGRREQGSQRKTKPTLRLRRADDDDREKQTTIKEKRSRRYG